ncbi:MAG: MarR family transcriptional regulator [Pseudomonadota bacterium]
MGKITRKTISDFITTLYAVQADKYGGETTLNELRVVAECYRAHAYGHIISVSTLANSLQIPMSTAHRAVTNLIAKGWIHDRRDPEDGRRRVIELTEKGLQTNLWETGAHWIEAFSEPLETDDAQSN